MAEVQSTSAHTNSAIVARFWAKVKKTSPDGCWLWTASRRSKGYGAFGYTFRGVKIQDRAHRFSYVLHVGPVPEGLCVLHNCPGGDNQACVNPAHLFVGTKADNNADMIAKGRQSKGESVKTAKMTADRVRTLRRRRAGGETIRRLAAEYSLSTVQTRDILRRRSWKHVDPQTEDA